MLKRKKQKAVSFVPGLSWTVRIRSAAFALLLFFFVCCAHASSLWNPLVLNDEISLRPFGAVSIEKRKWEPVWFELYTEAFQRPFSEPMKKLSMALDYQSGHLNAPSVYHASNLLFHALSVVLAYLLLVKVGELLALSGTVQYGRYLPLFACALFAVHPLTCESVAYVSARASILCFLIYMSACYVFLLGFTAKGVKSAVIFNLLSYLLIVLCIFSSCQSVSLPWTMLYMACLARETGYTLKSWVSTRVFEMSSLVLVGLALPFLFRLYDGLPELFPTGAPTLAPGPYMVAQLQALSSYYLRVFFAPVGLSIFPAGLSGQFDVYAIVSILVLAGAAVAIFAFHRRPYLSLGLYLFLVGLLPMSFLPSPIVAEGARFYMSTFGLCLALADLVFMLKPVQALEKNFDKKMGAILLLPIVVLAGLSNWRNHAYSANQSIIGGAIKMEKAAREEKGYLQSLLALLYSYQGGTFLDQARREAVAALTLKPELPLAQLAQGRYDESFKRYSSALFHYQRSLMLAEQNKCNDWLLAASKGGVARCMVGLEMLETPQDIQKVKEYSALALKYDPSNAVNYLAHGSAIMAEGHPESAELACREFDKGRKFDMNNPDFMYPLAVASLASGYKLRMEPAFFAALNTNRLNSTKDTRLLVARASLESGRIRRGYDYMSQYWDAEPDPSAEALLIMYGLEKQSGREAQAKWWLAQAQHKDKDILKKVRLHLVVEPKPLSDADNQGPDRLMPHSRAVPSIDK